jgi:tetratricopeptide (TPR) repeat protein
MPAERIAADKETGPLGTAVRLLRADAPGEIMRSPGSWPRWAVLLPHVLAATALLDQSQAPDPALLQSGAWLLDRAGTYLQVRARFRDAFPLLERAVAITEAAHGPDHPTVASRLNNLALVLGDLGQPETARPLLERALAIDEAAHGPDHPTVAIRLSNLATVLRDLGQPETAQPLLERALAITEAAHGPDHPDVATTLNNLALVLQDLGQPEAAQPLLERALAIDEAAHGPDHPDVATALNNLATVLSNLGQPEGL